MRELLVFDDGSKIIEGGALPSFHRSPAAILLLLILCAYLPVLKGGFNADDSLHFISVPEMAAHGGLAALWFHPSTPQYYPLTFSVFWLERRLWGLNPAAYHFLNVALFSANVVLVWRLLVLLGMEGAWFAAAIFALHPVHVESVAWVSELKNVLSGAFYFAAMIFYVRFQKEIRKRRPQGLDPSFRFYAASLAAFLLALLSKTSTVMLPVLIFFGVSWLDPVEPRKLTAFRLIPFMLLSALAGLVTMRFENAGGLTVGSEWALAWPAKIILSGKVVWFYLGKLAWPASLCFDYPRWRINPRDPISYLPTIAVLVLAAILWRRAQSWKTVTTTAAMGFFIINLFPVLGIFKIYFMKYTFVADRFQYLASLGPIAWAASFAVGYSRQVNTAIRSAFGAALLAILFALTWTRCGVFESAKSLWLDTLAKNPASFMAHNDLGLIYAGEGRWRDAVRQYHQVLRIRPQSSKTHANLAEALAAEGHLRQAAQEYEEALRLRPRNPYVLTKLAILMLRQKKIDISGALFRSALALNPAYPPALGGWGVALSLQGKFDVALLQFQRAAQAGSNDPRLYDNWGCVLMRLGQWEEAIACFKKALRQGPRYPPARRHLAQALRMLHSAHGGAKRHPL